MWPGTGRPGQAHSYCIDIQAANACKAGCAAKVAGQINASYNSCMAATRGAQQYCYSKCPAETKFRGQVCRIACDVAAKAAATACYTKRKLDRIASFTSVKACKSNCMRRHSYYVIGAKCPENWKTIIPIDPRAMIPAPPVSSSCTSN